MSPASALSAHNAASSGAALVLYCERDHCAVSIDAACNTPGAPATMQDFAYINELRHITFVLFGLRLADRHGVDERLGSKPNLQESGRVYDQ